MYALTAKFSAHSYGCSYRKNNEKCVAWFNPKGGGGTLIFSNIRKPGSFFGGSKFRISIFFGFSENIFGGMKILWIIFWGHHKIGLHVFRGHLYAF